MRRDPKKSKVVRELHMVETNCFTYHTNSRDNSPYDKCCPTGIELQANPKTENHARSDNPPLTTNHVSHWESQKRAKESSSRENGYLSKKAKNQTKSWSRFEMTDDKTFAVSWEEMVGSSKTCW
jgi:hypothetical protein